MRGSYGVLFAVACTPARSCHNVLLRRMPGSTTTRGSGPPDWMTLKEHSLLKSDSETTRPEPGTVRIERVMPATRDRVWQYIVDPDLRASWLAGGALDHHAGGRIELEFDYSSITADPKPDFDDDVPPIQ